uniref:Uncharacterized protein n=1 Tax=Arundo donax TaxID=35708 RepID=A0A0A9BM34_ARUDO
MISLNCSSLHDKNFNSVAVKWFPLQPLDVYRSHTKIFHFYLTLHGTCTHARARTTYLPEMCCIQNSAHRHIHYVC